MVCIAAVDSRTRKTAILRRFEDMVCKIRNELLPILDKKVLVDGKIPSGRQAEECIEAQGGHLVQLRTAGTDGLDLVKLCIHWFERMQVKLTTASCPAVYVVKTVPSDAKVLAEALRGSRQTVWYPKLPSCTLVPRVPAGALAESAVLCASIHAPPVPSVSGYAFARPTLHTSGIHAVRRLKVV